MQMARQGIQAVTEQLPLSPTIHAVHSDNGRRIRALLNRAINANGLSHVDLSHETGIDEKQIGRSLRDDGGAHPPLSLLACVLAKDRLGIFVSGMCAMVGRDAVERKPDPAAENRKLREELGRIRDEVARLLDGSQP
jgi:hypothetical protein